MICNVCGHEIAEGATFCTECGSVITNAPAAPVEPAQDMGTPVKDPGKGFGIASLILGICGIVFTVSVLPVCCFGFWGAIAFFFCLPFCLACGVVGLILGIIGQKKTAAVGLKNSLTKTGITLSGIALGLVGLLALLAILVLLLGIVFIIGYFIFIFVLSGSMSYSMMESFDPSYYYYY